MVPDVLFISNESCEKNKIYHKTQMLIFTHIVIFFMFFSFCFNFRWRYHQNEQVLKKENKIKIKETVHKN